MGELSRLQSLLDEVHAGSEQAAWQLVREYSGHVLRVIRRALPKEIRSKFDSEDFAQEVWQSVFAERSRLREASDPESLVRLLAAVARNKVIDEFRRRLQTKKHGLQREQHLGDTGVGDGIPAVDPTPSEWIMAREKWDQLNQGLSVQEQQMLALRREGLTLDQIAERLGIGERTVRRLLRRLEGVRE